MRADGEVRWVLDRGQLVAGPGGQLWMDGAIFDVTERRAAEEALRRRQIEDVRTEELRASRVRIVQAADAARRRIERDLHDGAQQRLVSLGLGLRAAQEAVPSGHAELKTELERAADGLVEVLKELQELCRGLHPAVLSTGGLRPALKGLARRSAVPVELDVRVPGRMPERTEVAAYFVVSEALANVAKHAHASVVQVRAEVQDGALRVLVRDDGIGGADPSRGSGLTGLTDRVEATGGTIDITSHAGAGTRILAELPASDS